MNTISMRTLTISGAYNIRDLGGLLTKNGLQTRFGVLIRGDSPHAASPQALQSLITYGVNQVVDLRSPHECAVDPNPFVHHAQVSYAHVPLRGTGLRAYDLRQITQIDRYYQTLLDTAHMQFARVFALLAAADTTTLFHCRIGKDRTGMVAAMILDAVGVPHDTIIADYAQTTANIVPLITRYQAERPFYVRQQWYEGLFEAKTVYMERFLQNLTRSYGGGAGYFQRIGADGALATLRSRLCTSFDVAT